ncbi:MAG: hypothetical protein ACRD1E_09485, partial [Terriglobales bacterium]
MQPLFYAALALAAGIAAAASLPASLSPLAAAGASAAVWGTMAAGLAAATALAAMTKRAPRAGAAALGLALCFCFGFARGREALLRPHPPAALEQAASALQPRARDRIELAGYLRDAPELLYEGGRPSAVRLDLEAVSVAGAGVDTPLLTW